MGKIKDFYFEISSNDYGKLYNLGWMLLSSLIITIILLEGLMIIGGPGETFDLEDILGYFEVLITAPFVSLCIVGVRLFVKALNKVFIILDSFIIKGIIYIASTAVLLSIFGDLLADAPFLPESEVLKYICMTVFTLIYIGVIVLCYKSKNRYIEKNPQINTDV